MSEMSAVYPVALTAYDDNYPELSNYENIDHANDQYKS